MSQQRGVLTVTGKATGCEAWRIWWPAAALQAQGYPAAWQYRNTPPPADLAARYAAVVWARLSWPRAHYTTARAWRDDLHRRGLAVLYELDDDIISPAHEQQAVIRSPHLTLAEIEQQRQDRLYALRLCDGVTVPTVALAQVVEQYTDAPVAVVPSAIPWAAWRTACRQGAGYRDRARPAPVIGWAGGPRHDADFRAMAEAWGQVARQYPEVQFVAIGYCSPRITAAVPAGQLTVVPWQPVESYPQAYRGIDIFCCPLADTAFNRAKSPIKSYEAACAGAAVVYSPTVYGQVMRPGLDGVRATDTGSWEAALSVWIEMPEWAQKQAAGWATRVQQRHNLDADASAWPRAWGKLIGAARVPAGVR